METLAARALTADWLNAWLAAIGITALTGDIELSWTDSPIPHAVLHSDRGTVIDRIVESFPDVEALECLAIARVHPDCPDGAELQRNVTPSSYSERAELVRAERGSDFSLAATVTDLDEDAGAHSPFDPPMPRGITIGQRLVSCRKLIDDESLPEAIERTLVRGGTRHQNNGLGFDYRRIPSPTDPHGDVFVDPVVEVLAFHGLALLPIRGNGRRSRTRGLTASAFRPGSLTWPAWRRSLNYAAIDALLDRFWAADGAGRDGLAPDSFVVKFESLAYQPRGKMDQTRGLASRQMSSR